MILGRAKSNTLTITWVKPQGSVLFQLGQPQTATSGMCFKTAQMGADWRGGSTSLRAFTLLSTIGFLSTPV